MKRFLALFLIVVLFCATVSTASATNGDAVAAADKLHSLGLFNGTGTDADGNPMYDLDRAPTRHEAVTMLVRLLGKGDEALAGTWEMPFTDVAEWAKPYVGYAYANGLTSGTSRTTFGGNAIISASQYLTFLLRTLGYETGKDFQWDKAWELSDHIGLTSFGEYGAGSNFVRGDVAILSLRTYQLQKTLETAPSWGLPADIRWISEPTCGADVDNNTLYSFLIGNYALQTPVNASWFLAGKEAKTVRELSWLYPDLMGAYANFSAKTTTDTALAPGRAITITRYVRKGIEPTLSMTEVYEKQLAALDKAIEIKESLHQSNRIKPGMSEQQIAQVYYNYLVNMGASPGGGSNAAAKGQSVEYDTVYACLVKKKADCVGRAAAFNLLMHLEGISAQGVSGSMKGTDSSHVLSRVVLDGQEYFCDWGNKKGISQNITSWFIFDTTSLDAARAIN